MPKSTFEMATNPEVIIFLPFAVLVDIISIVLVCCGLDDFWILDVIAWSVIGTWSLFRSQIISIEGAQPIDISSMRGGSKKQQIQEAKKIAEQVKKSQKAAKAAKWAKQLKWLEFIPYVGVLPFWTISVWMTIKYS